MSFLIGILLKVAAGNDFRVGQRKWLNNFINFRHPTCPKSNIIKIYERQTWPNALPLGESFAGSNGPWDELLALMVQKVAQQRQFPYKRHLSASPEREREHFGVTGEQGEGRWGEKSSGVGGSETEEAAARPKCTLNLKA